MANLEPDDDAASVLCTIIKCCGSALQQHSQATRRLLALRSDGLRYHNPNAVIQHQWTAHLHVVQHGKYGSLHSCLEMLLLLLEMQEVHSSRY